MERKMSGKLLEWKNSKEKTPLILYGARQVGKTYTILSFGKENYKNVAYINWESNGKAEVDFVVQDKEGNIIPIEVKSSIHTRSKSLNVFKGLYKIPYSIRISTKNFGFENDIKCIPLYSVFCLDNL